MSTVKRILLINGPNLNLLGLREPGHYGNDSLDSIVSALTAKSTELGVTLEHIQSNAEHEIIDAIHQAYGKVDFIIINPAAFTHTSVAIRDALLGVAIPFIEVHLSNVHTREPFRHHSYLSDKAVGVICGLGKDGYEFALTAAVRRLQSDS
ncbi:type II 3-dehydroquinate dehydratase [Photobacterium damselae subsp. piscicida]|uniref:3-dehydroquinate dehydratase n=1 Tax=Photobacterium damsela subsp. piscicida TaxID=38294 RepID=A0A1Q9H0A5_PHODP|nr:type II 3-dehydroquinate dehydratase [Photobacterium damselae]MBE8130328.1 type II 3-dehydroquinate dehydratase [Photobacterium damselae subsp. piscicida]MDP2515658.1 type II 3-dehydroquinate dehydratase [Photobacterium damselae subsp. piscicida]MDP2531926.1 type II 3-dehydroquinate dehydratase [Photobacterium damselae subsp. piscicida]MDP2544651.1 type II 3-dehydroquinate dehydratase [Photobacterium damselae subsp. piscicida]MDP2556335.1 type II 3-dehydroquinate dehydratase [Photobacterium